MIRLNLSALGLGMLIFGMLSCKKDVSTPTTGTANYNMTFNLTASGAPVEMGQTVTNAPTRYYFDIMRFYAGLPRLVKTDGSEVALSDLFIVKFDQGIPDNTVCRHSFTFSIPAGSYKAIRFGIGVPPAIKDTVTHYHYGPLDPLNDDYGLHWAMSTSGKKNVFRNIGINMYADTSTAQNQPLKRLLSFHILEDDTTLNLYRTLEFPEEFSVGSGGNHNIVFNVDANNLFFNSSSPIDLRHAGSTDMVKGDDLGIQLGVKLNRNFYSAISKQ
jgi:hypothetical protein